jgi:hypothetical protein
MRTPPVILLIAALVAGCESASDEAAPAAEGVRASAAVAEVAPPLDLEATAALIRDHRVKDASELEVQLNGSGHQVDVDRDGKRDRLQVVEIREDDTRRFEVRALPGKQRATVPIATIELVRVDDTAEVTLRYADAPILITFELPLVVDTFCYWVFVVERPVFVGVGYVIVYDRPTHKKYKKHKK